MDLNVALLPQQNDPAGHPEGTVFVVLDTSGSMAGSKINQVIASLKEIIEKAPLYLRFCVRVFNTTVQLLVTKKKKYLDVPRLFNSVQQTVGSSTALYDAWGVTLKEIPYNANKLDLVHVIIFTDGEDNCSKEYNLASVLELSKEKIHGSKMQLSFIQAGQSSRASEAVNEMDKKHFNVYNVEDSAVGIKFAFGKVSQAIQLQLQFKVGLSEITSNLAMLGVGNRPGHSPRLSLQFQSGGASHALTLQQSSPGHFRKQGGFQPRFKSPAIMGGSDPRVLSQSMPVTKGTIAKQELFPFSLKVENIPKNVKDYDLTAHFQQWGDCKLQTLVPAQKNSQMAVISYKRKREQEFAVKYAGSMGFRGNFLIVSSV